MPKSQPPPPPQHPLALPPHLSPDALDAITELAAILTRLRPPQSAAALGAPPPSLLATGTTPAANAVTGTTPLPTAATPAAGGPGGGGGGGGSGLGGHVSFGGASPSDAPISLKDVPTATDALKHKIQRARQQIKALPDMSRTIAEQEEHISELEETIRLQQEVLAGLRGIGVQFGAEGGDRMEM
ncbi:hypothetical protein RB597_001372 [Gaeumannomyces tritici]